MDLVEPLKVCLAQNESLALLGLENSVQVLALISLNVSLLHVKLLLDLLDHLLVARQDLLHRPQFPFLLLFTSAGLGVSAQPLRLALDLEALRLELVVLHKLVGAAVVSVAFVHNVVADFLDAFINVHVHFEQLFHYFLVNLSVLVVHLLLRGEGQVVWQISLVPLVLLDFLESDALHGIGLKHAVNEILDLVAETWNKIFAFLNFVEEDGHMVVVERKTAAYHCVEDHATAPNVDLSATIAHTTNDFGGRVVGRSTGSLKGERIPHDVSKSEVYKSDV